MCVTPIQILPVTLSEHNPLVTQVDVSFKVNKTKLWRFNTTLLQKKLFVVEFQAVELLAEKKDSVEDPKFTWMATKGLIRDIYFASQLIKVRNHRIKLSEKHF